MLFHLNPLTGVRGGRKIFRGCQWMAKVQSGIEKMLKISTG